MTSGQDITIECTTGGQLVVDCLLASRPPLWTCVPGESFLPILDALIEPCAQGTARLVTTRHEAAAANMAEAAGKLTGRPAVCLVTRGPGATHAAIAVHTAFQDGTPLILVVGQVARGHLRREAFQEMDYAAVFGSFTKDVITVLDADRIPEHVAAAIHTATSERPGPVVLVVPEDVLDAPTRARPVTLSASVAPRIAEENWRALRTMIESAVRPVLVVGGPGWTAQAAADIVQFAARNQVPVVTAFRWQDAIDNTDPCFAGFLGLGCSPLLRALLAESDLVIALGPRLDDPTTGGYEFPAAETPLVQVSRSERELGRYPFPALAVLADPATVCHRLNELTLRPDENRTDWFARLRAQQVSFAPATATGSAALGVDLAEVVRQVRYATSDDAVVTTGAGNYTVWVQRFFRFRRFGTQLAPRNGAMGYGLPAALAAAAVYPGRTVVAFAGDGCFMMSGHELATAVQHELPVVVIVVNNSQFGTIRMHQERRFPGRQIATALCNPDFVSYAQSFGVHAARVTETSAFAKEFKAALAHSGPAVIEVVTDGRQLTPDRHLP